MTSHSAKVAIRGPWSLATSKEFWEGFAPAALERDGDAGVRTAFVGEADWRPVAAELTQPSPARAEIALSGDGDLEAAVEQVRRFCAIDVDGREWPDVGERDPVIAKAQEKLPGFRPCGFHSPYEAAAWSVLSQRVRMTQAASLRRRLTEELGEDGAFPAPATLRDADLDLPGRKAEYLAAVAEAALEGALDGERLRALDPDDAVASLEEIKGIGPFAADLVVIRGANAPDALPRKERRLEAVVADRYGEDASLAEVAETWRPFRGWACVHLRALGAAAT